MRCFAVVLLCLLLCGWCQEDATDIVSTDIASEEPTATPTGEESTSELAEMLIQCKKETEHEVLCEDVPYESAEVLPFGSEKWCLFAGLSVLLVCTAGLMSGLQLGLLSLDMNNLKVILRAGETLSEQQNAKKILPLVQRHHLLMVTLLIVNAACMESLPLFLDKLMSPFANIIVSVTAVLLFGEILPQAVCSRYGLAIGATMSPIVWAMVILTFVISWPISKLLDLVLGTTHGTFFRRSALSEMVNLQATEAHGESALTADECTIIQGALALKEKTALDCKFTHLDKVFMLDFENSKLDTETLQSIKDQGHSRIPVFRGDRSHVHWVLLTKALILVDPNEALSLNSPSLNLIDIPTVPEDTPVYTLLNLFQTGKSHMALVISKEDFTRAIGVITLEDVLEELLQEEILDEEDLRKEDSFGQSSNVGKNLQHKLMLGEAVLKATATPRALAASDNNFLMSSMTSDRSTLL